MNKIKKGKGKKTPKKLVYVDSYMYKMAQEATLPNYSLIFRS